MKEALSRTPLTDSVYRVTQVTGSSADAWEAAARNAVETAAKTVRNLRVAEVDKLGMTIDSGQTTSYRARVNISFKYETWRPQPG
jgi:flavin-binding protein dodecin